MLGRATVLPQSSVYVPEWRNQKLAILYNLRNGMEPPNGTNENVSCIIKVIQFAEYIQFQLTGGPYPGTASGG